MKPLSRRTFIGFGIAAAVPRISRGAEGPKILGQGEFRYRVVPDWGVLGPDTPVDNCHGIVCDRQGHIILLTDHVKNNFIVYDSAGKLVYKWGTQFPGAHGLSLVEEKGKEFLYFTDLKRHKVFKATTGGEMLEEWGWPEATGKYAKEDEYRPSWTLHSSNGEFYVLDGYGKDFVIHYGADGEFVKIFGGQEGGIAQWGPHGGMVDARNPDHPTLLIAMSDQQSLLHLGIEGATLGETSLPGGNPRQIRMRGEHYFVTHLADNWPKDRESRGFVSVMDADFRVISNLAGTAPEYDDTGKLRRMRQVGEIFMHPHDLAVDGNGSIHVAQFSSNQTYPIKLERI